MIGMVSPLSTVIKDEEPRQLEVRPIGARLHSLGGSAQLRYRVRGLGTPAELMRTCELLARCKGVVNAFFSRGSLIIFVGPTTMARRARRANQKEVLISHFEDVIRNVVNQVRAEAKIGRLALNAGLQPARSGRAAAGDDFLNGQVSPAPRPLRFFVAAHPTTLLKSLRNGLPIQHSVDFSYTL